MSIQTVSQAFTNEGLGGFSFRNLLINGDFQIDQRGYSGTTSTTGNKYTVDRWTNYFATTITKSKEVIAGRRRGTLTLNSSSDGDITQRIENSDLISGQTLTVSFWAKSNSGSTAAKIQVGNNIDAGLVNENFTLTTSWQKYAITFTMPAFSNLAGTTYSYLTFTSTAGTINYSLSEVQLEVGSVATPFEIRPYGLELQLCQRYFYVFPPRNGGALLWTTCYLSSSAYAVAIIPVSMRTLPTPTDPTSGSSTVSSGAGNVYSSNGTTTNGNTSSGSQPVLSTTGKADTPILIMRWSGASQPSSLSNNFASASFNGGLPGIFLDAEL